MTPRVALLLAIGTATAVLVAAQIAGGAPTPPTEQPTISGQPRYQSQLSCKQGRWGADATSFTYSWHFAGSATQIATGQNHRPGIGTIGQSIFCRVSGADIYDEKTTADSAPVTIGPGRTTIKLKAKSPQRSATIKLTGKVGPPEAIKPMAKGDQRGSVVGYRVERGTLFQLFGKIKLDNRGRFSITAPSKFGKYRYKVNFNPNEASLWEFSSGFKKVKLKKKP